MDVLASPSLSSQPSSPYLPIHSDQKRMENLLDLIARVMTKIKNSNAEQAALGRQEILHYKEKMWVVTGNLSDIAGSNGINSLATGIVSGVLSFGAGFGGKAAGAICPILAQNVAPGVSGWFTAKNDQKKAVADCENQILSQELNDKTTEAQNKSNSRQELDRVEDEVRQLFMSASRGVSNPCFDRIR